MSFTEVFLNYFQNSSVITIIVLFWLSIYFLISFTVLFSRIVGLNNWRKREKSALEAIVMGATIEATNSCLNKVGGEYSKAKLDVCYSLAEYNATSGLTILSIIASTSPFIGLFGTVISILQTFAVLGDGANGLNIIAPAISEALVATGCGIFVAIPAYSFNLLIKRKAYEILGIIKREIDILLNAKEGR